MFIAGQVWINERVLVVLGKVYQFPKVCVDIPGMGGGIYSNLCCRLISIWHCFPCNMSILVRVCITRSTGVGLFIWSLLPVWKNHRRVTPNTQRETLWNDHPACRRTTVAPPSALKGLIIEQKERVHINITTPVSTCAFFFINTELYHSMHHCLKLRCTDMDVVA